MTTDNARPLRDQPRVRGNDWPSLRAPALGEWQPTRSVTVVVPAYRPGPTLALTLAALAHQSYPEQLLEVVVVDDDPDEQLRLPELRPARTRVVPSDGSWGRAHACHVGALAADGEVLHWLDADMVPHREQVEAQLRWHHLLDHAAVLGHKTFVDVEAGLPTPEEVAAAVTAGRAEDLFPGRWTAPHEWVEEHVTRTEGLTRNPTMSFLVHVGATASVSRDLYLASGGMDGELKLGEDVELGYRLAQQGAVFVPDAEARSWHLGRSTLMGRQDEVNAYNRPFVTDRVPALRHWRSRGRSYSVPWVQVVVDATAAPARAVWHSVEGVLTGSTHDVEVLVVGPWSELGDERRSPLGDPRRDLRLAGAGLVGDPRVRLVEAVTESAAPATFRLWLPAGWAPGADSLRRLGTECTRRDRGLVQLLLPTGEVARLERTSAFARARRLLAAGDPDGAVADDIDGLVDGVVDEVSRSWWFEGREEGFTHVDDEPAAPAAPSGGGRKDRKDRPPGGPRRPEPPAEAEVPVVVAEQPTAVRSGAGRSRRRLLGRRTGPGS